MDKIEFWKDRGKKIIDPELFSKKAENFALEIAKDNEQSRGVNKRTQLRKFFDEIVNLNMRAKTSPHGWENILPLVHMVTAKAAYAKGRKLISDNFLNFIKESVNQVEEPCDLDVFNSFFESFIGFYRLHGPSK
jgi:CRISPR-associated protein Csm2